MVVLHIDMISKEMIQPSSPTPHHLRTQKLSFLDQIAPPVYVPLIFFYQNNEPNVDNVNPARTQLLKQSLSKIVTQFHPIAGRIQENTSIDCNDAGVEFIEARVHTHLIQVIQDPEMDQLNQLLPVEPLSRRAAKDNAILSVKMSTFDCGGIAVGVCLSHKIADGPSLVTFMNAWAATCRHHHHDQVTIHQQDPPPPRPNLDLGVQYFPPKDLSKSNVSPNVGVTKDRITTKRFVFSREKLTKLKHLAADRDGKVKDPTRVEAVSAFFWSHFLEAAKGRNDLKGVVTSSVGVHAVNLRTRTNPAMPEHAFGNWWRPVFAFLPGTEGSWDLVSKLRGAIRGIDEDYIEKVRNGEYLSLLSKTVDDYSSKWGDKEICYFSSWCRFPMYEVDFGWGKPVWVCTTTLPFKNLVILMSTAAGDGIEAWVNVPDGDLKMLETHYDLLTC